MAITHALTALDKTPTYDSHSQHVRDGPLIFWRGRGGDEKSGKNCCKIKKPK